MSGVREAVRGVLALPVPDAVAATVIRALPDAELVGLVREVASAGAEAEEGNWPAGMGPRAVTRERMRRLAVALGRTGAALEAAADPWAFLEGVAVELLVRASKAETTAAAAPKAGAPKAEETAKRRGRPPRAPTLDEETAFRAELRDILGEETPGYVGLNTWERTEGGYVWTIEARASASSPWRSMTFRLPEGVGPFSRDALRFIRKRAPEAWETSQPARADASREPQGEERRQPSLPLPGVAGPECQP